MQNATHKSWATPRAMVVLSLFCGSAAFAGPFDEPHLDIIPRTEEEAARIAKVTAPATSFDEPQKYERLSAGAATVRVLSNVNAFS